MKHLSAVIIAICGLSNSAALAEGDAAKGETIFKKCVACHHSAKAENKTGPHLIGIVGRAVASIEGFKYSTGMLDYAKTTPVWDEANLDTYLSDPRKTVPGTKMALAPLKKPDERADLIAFLKTLESQN